MYLFFNYLFLLEDDYFIILWWFLSYINMNKLKVYMCTPSWTPFPPPSPTLYLCVFPEDWFWVPCFMHQIFIGHLFYYCTQWSKSERERQMLYINAYIWNLERWYWWSYMQGSKGNTDVKSRLLDSVEEGIYLSELCFWFLQKNT